MPISFDHLMKKESLFWGSLFLISFLLHWWSSGMLGFHRDEFLYLALGAHPGIGHWSNPPLLGWLSWFSQNVFGESLRAIHVFPAVAGALMSLFSCLIAKELGGQRFAIGLTFLATLFHLAFLRAFSFLMPVPFDILFWTFYIYLLIRFLNTENKNYLLYLGVAIGLGMLNKYSVAFFVLAMILGVLLTPQRKLIFTKTPYQAMALGLLVFLPNLLWQFYYGFPVIHHMQELSENQLQNVQPLDFIADQFVVNWQNVFLFVPGLFFLLGDKKNTRFRWSAWIAVLTVFLFLMFKGKSYYTLGIFPPLIAAGAVFWEEKIKIFWLRMLFAAALVGLILPIIPMAIPIFSADGLQKYFAQFPLETALRWEDGASHALPQDYADMLGWQELADGVGKAYELCDLEKPVIIYAENYGQAGAIDHLGKKYGLPPVNSFADSYRLWNGENLSTEVDQFIYVNDNLGEDIENLFARVILVDRVKNPRARELGTRVYLCREPTASFKDFWNSRLEEVRAASGL